MYYHALSSMCQSLCARNNTWIGQVAAVHESLAIKSTPSGGQTFSDQSKTLSTVDLMLQ